MTSSVLKNTLLVPRPDGAATFSSRKCLKNGGALRPGMAESGKKHVKAGFFNRLLVSCPINSFKKAVY